MTAPVPAAGDALDAQQADELGRRFVGALRERDARRGDRVALVAPSTALLVAAALGALRAGIVPVVLDPATPEEELSEVLTDADPVVVVHGTDELAALTLRPPADDLGDGLADVPLGRPMHYTSGTTGRRKGVWSGVLSPAAAHALWAEERDLWRLGPTDVHVVMSPLHHSAPLRFAMGSLLAGGRVVVPGRFEVGRFLDACRRHRPTTAFTAPAQLQRLREHTSGSAGAAADVAAALRGLRLLAHAGAPCPEPVKRWLLDLVGTEPVWEFYGSTEGQFTACSAAEWLDRPGTVGRARPGRRLAVDQDGTIWCTVPDFARFTYWRDQDKTASAWRDTPDGPAFSVGDHGRLDEDGYLRLDGRREDLVVTGGVNVYPLEVERVLGACPGVRDVAAFGVDDERWGQRLEVAVVGAVTPEQVSTYAGRHLPPARRPKRVHLLDALPRTSTGKVRRLDLPELVAQPASSTPR